MKILLIEDDLKMAQKIQLLLADNQHEVITANTLDLAELSFEENHDIGLVISDNHLNSKHSG